MGFIRRVLTDPRTRITWALLMLVLAACNNGDSGGGNGY